MQQKVRAKSAPVRSSSSKSRTGSGRKTPVQKVNLGFDGPRGQYSSARELNNGIRPHGGYRGTNQFPPALYSGYESPLDQFSLQSPTPKTAPPSPSDPPLWMSRLFKEPSHTSESPLFIHRLLSPDKSKQRKDPGNMPKYLTGQKKTRTKKKNSVQYYRPDKPHEYLTATAGPEDEEFEAPCGRPTRSTLLRARQRCTSAPINAYEARREMLRKLEERCQRTRTSLPTRTSENRSSQPDCKESMHGFLTGARYNRAHLIDARGLDHGIYMPRNNPLSCFQTKAAELKEAANIDNQKETTKSAAVQETCKTQASPVPRPPTNPPPSPHSSSPNDSPWVDNTQVQVDIQPETFRVEKKHNSNSESPDCFIILNKALNVKGQRLVSTCRPKSASSIPSTPSADVTKKRPQSALPSVIISERSREICITPSSSVREEPSCDTSVITTKEKNPEDEKKSTVKKVRFSKPGSERVEFFVTEKNDVPLGIQGVVLYPSHNNSNH